MRALEGDHGETRWVNGGPERKATELEVGPAEASVHNPPVLVQLCADTPFSKRSSSLTHSRENILWGVVTVT